MEHMEVSDRHSVVDCPRGGHVESKTYKAVFLIPYYGRIPEYFDLWAQSAAKNTDFAFYIFSDLPFDVAQYDNIQVFHMSFAQLTDRIQNLMDFRITLHSPYKLCDYKPAYGHIFAEYIQGFDFWGFCDVDVILGKLSHFITDDLLAKYDKILYQGHFTIMRNNEQMNLLYRRVIKNVQDYKFAFTTKLDCHFDENGTIAYADEYDETIRFAFGWIFYDTNVYLYQLTIGNTEACVCWDDGVLTAYWDNGNQAEEYMYIHLQKRRMIRRFTGQRDTYVIMRNEFLELEESGIAFMLRSPIDIRTKEEFEEGQMKRRRQILTRKVLAGWIPFKVTSILKKWRKVKKLQAVI